MAIKSICCLEKYYECLSNLSENIFAVVINEMHCVATW